MSRNVLPLQVYHGFFRHCSRRVIVHSHTIRNRVVQQLQDHAMATCRRLGVARWPQPFSPARPDRGLVRPGGSELFSTVGGPGDSQLFSTWDPNRVRWDVVGPGESQPVSTSWDPTPRLGFTMREAPWLPFSLHSGIVVQVCIQPVCAILEGERAQPTSTVIIYMYIYTQRGT